MPKYASRQEVQDKAEWEGSATELIFSYGFTPEDFPDDMPDDVKEAVTRLNTQAAADLDTFENWLYDRQHESQAV